MPGNLSDYAEKKILDHSVGKASWLMPTTVYCALYTTTPTDSTATSSTGEVSTTSTGYARVLVSNSSGTGTQGSVFSSADSSTAGAATIKNNHTYNATSAGLSASGSGIITFPTATAAWGSVVAVALVDAATAGNILWYGTLTVAKTVANGDTVSFAAGDLVLSLD